MRKVFTIVDELLKEYVKQLVELKNNPSDEKRKSVTKEYESKRDQYDPENLIGREVYRLINEQYKAYTIVKVIDDVCGEGCCWGFEIASVDAPNILEICSPSEIYLNE